MKFKTSLTSIHKLHYRFGLNLCSENTWNREMQSSSQQYSSSIEPSSNYMLKLMSVTTNNFFMCTFLSIKLMTLFSMDARFNLPFATIGWFSMHQLTFFFRVVLTKPFHDIDNNRKCHEKKIETGKWRTMAKKPTDQLTNIRWTHWNETNENRFALGNIYSKTKVLISFSNQKTSEPYPSPLSWA